MPLRLVPHPGGMRDNSPMFQHWGEPGKWQSSPEGTAEGSRAVSAVPSGLDDLGTDQPNVETLGYCRMSLRVLSVFHSLFAVYNPSGIGAELCARAPARALT